MACGTLEINLDAVVANWRRLDRMTPPTVETAAVVKADAYSLGADRVGAALMAAGARRFFVAVAEEGARLRQTLGPGADIMVLSGHMQGDGGLIARHDLVPMLSSPAQAERQFRDLPGRPFGIQLESGLNRLGIGPEAWAALRAEAIARGPRLLMSHLASSDEPGSDQNARQLAAFRALTDGLGIQRSLSASSGILLGRAYDFDMVRPGIGLYGGMAFPGAEPVVRLSLPVVQVRTVRAGEAVGYNATWQAPRDTVIATLGAGYADGILRSLSGRATLYHGQTPCPLVARVSMDLVTVDVSALEHVPEALDLIGPAQGVNELAAQAGTIGYEVLTALGPRYARRYARRGDGAPLLAAAVEARS